MKRNIKILGIAVLCCLSVSACSDDNTVFNEPEAIRSYETDAQIMAQFVEVDRTTGTYVLNPDKKNGYEVFWKFVAQ